MMEDLENGIADSESVQSEGQSRQTTCCGTRLSLMLSGRAPNIRQQQQPPAAVRYAKKNQRILVAWTPWSGYTPPVNSGKRRAFFVRYILQRMVFEDAPSYIGTHARSLARTCGDSGWSRDTLFSAFSAAYPLDNRCRYYMNNGFYGSCSGVQACWKRAEKLRSIVTGHGVTGHGVRAPAPRVPAPRAPRPAPPRPRAPGRPRSLPPSLPPSPSLPHPGPRAPAR